MTTEQAFKELIYNTEYRKTLPRKEQNSLLSYKSMYESGKLDLSRIDKLLVKHGYEISQEILWAQAKKEVHHE